MDFKQQELLRYSRHLILPEIGESGQLKLKNARVLLIGLGGLGSPVSLYLAAAGVGTLGLADFDTVTEHNLQRQIIHDSSKTGESKLASAISRLHALNPYVELIAHPEGVQVQNVLELFSQYDLVVDGSDNFPTRYLVNDAAYIAGIPLVYGSVFQFEGQMTVFDQKAETPCYRCLFPKMPEPGTVPNCEEAGVFGALCGVIGSLQAMEAIKWITGVGDISAGKLNVFDVLKTRFRSLQIKRDPRCPLCGESPTINSLEARNYLWNCSIEPSDISDDVPLEISVEEAARLLKATNNPPILLDVRESFELKICQIPGHVHIPLRTLTDRLDELPRDRMILTLCQHGIRSLTATRMLRDQGMKSVSSIKGGIVAWSEKIDPEMPQY